MGKLIVIEGTDGSGKETQSNLLFDNLKKMGIKIQKISFPNYESPACEPVKMYLAGKFGKDPLSVNPYPISMMYAIDRYASFKEKWEEFYNDDGVIITDRYVTSNMIHQGSKILDLDEKKIYLDWLCDLEYDKIKVPRADITIFLNMPIEKSFELMAERKNKITGESKKDIHEENRKYLEISYQTACDISTQYNWEEIKCMENNQLKTIEEIQEEISEKVKKILFL
ncbi:dTMP kinase [Fusobacterium sp. PH5-44]|uniref:dTMP kinase n=1 Tax=unclassified Fusobacterium TaxID=2648384 RepID=UPI003D21172B